MSGAAFLSSDVGKEESSSLNDGWAWMSSAMVEEGEMEVMIIHTFMSPMLALGFIRDPMRPLVSSKAVYIAWMKSPVIISLFTPCNSMLIRAQTCLLQKLLQRVWSMALGCWTNICW